MIVIIFRKFLILIYHRYNNRESRILVGFIKKLVQQLLTGYEIQMTL